MSDKKYKYWLILLIAGSLAGVILFIVLFSVFHKSRTARSPVITASVPTHDTSAPAPALLLPEANPYGPNDFQFVNGYLTCLTADSRLGIDVSAHQGVIDWPEVAKAGIEFAFVRVGYRGYETGSLVLDGYASKNLAGARHSGLDVGVYFYSQAISPDEARAEAAFVLDFLARQPLDLPVVFDWEFVTETARTGQMDSRTLTDTALAFCQAIEQAGYQPMIYFNRHLAKDLFRLEELTAYPFWLAMYQMRMTYPYRIEFWQYTSEGTVPGIEGNVDLNLQLP